MTEEPSIEDATRSFLQNPCDETAQNIKTASYMPTFWALQGANDEDLAQKLDDAATALEYADGQTAIIQSYAKLLRLRHRIVVNMKQGNDDEVKKLLREAHQRD